MLPPTTALSSPAPRDHVYIRYVALCILKDLSIWMQPHCRYGKALIACLVHKSRMEGLGLLGMQPQPFAPWYTVFRKSPANCSDKHETVASTACKGTDFGGACNACVLLVATDCRNLAWNYPRFQVALKENILRRNRECCAHAKRSMYTVPLTFCRFLANTSVSVTLPCCTHRALYTNRVPK